MSSYSDFLASKALHDPDTGIAELPDLPAALFPFQADITRWALRRGRAAIFAGTGLGKSFMELAWGAAVADHTEQPVLLLTPLAVAPQMVREAEKFALRAVHCRDESEIPEGASVVVTNYQRLDHFDLAHFGGVILDESSILKHYAGHYRTRLIEECAQISFRLAATATPAPNDFMELGNHAEFLGVMSYTDMLATFFVHDGGDTGQWRLKGHAEDAFWRWMCSWSVMLRQPGDLGYVNTGYGLPPLRQHQHVVDVDYAPSIETGFLLPLEAVTMQERLAARRNSVVDRVALAASITPQDRPFVWWCNLNAESAGLARSIPGAVEVHGSDHEDDKERKLEDFSTGRVRVLVTKPSICGWGVNWQHCADTGFVGLSDSFEAIYQAIRRFWRFGQTKPVNAHFITAETEGAVLANIRRKEVDAERMADAMVRHTADISSAGIRGAIRDTMIYQPEQPMKLPAWVGGRAA